MNADDLRRILDPQARAAAYTAWKREQAEAARQADRFVADEPAHARYATGVDVCHETGHTTTVTIRQDPDGTCTVVSSETTKVTAVGLVVPESDADATFRQWVGKGLTFWVISSAPKQAWVERAIGLGDLDSFTAHGEAFWANGARMFVVDPHDGDRIRGMDISRLFIESIPSSRMMNSLRVLFRHGSMHHDSPSVVATTDPWVLRELGLPEVASGDQDGGLHSGLVRDDAARSPFEGLHNEPAPPLKPPRPMTSDELSKIAGSLPKLDIGYRPEVVLGPKNVAERYREHHEILRLKEAVGPDAAARAREEARTTTKSLRECLREEKTWLDAFRLWQSMPARSSVRVEGDSIIADVPAALTGDIVLTGGTFVLGSVPFPKPPSADGELVPMSIGYKLPTQPDADDGAVPRGAGYNWTIDEVLRAQTSAFNHVALHRHPQTGGGALTGPPIIPSTRVEVVGEQRPPCPDCKGTGLYQGLFIVEPCQACGGGGRCG